MPQRGEIVVERLTGRRAVVIRVVGPDEVTCRFGDGRLEDRFVFELSPAPPTWVDTVFSFFKSPFSGFKSPFSGLSESPKKRPAPQGNAVVRPRVTRPPDLSAPPPQ